MIPMGCVWSVIRKRAAGTVLKILDKHDIFNLVLQWLVAER